jgi:heme exporter protein C
VTRTASWIQLASPVRFEAFARRATPALWGCAIVFGLLGLYAGLVLAPSDAQQGEVYRIIFIHVPAAWMSMLIYVVLAFWAVWGWAFGARLASMYAQALAPTGAGFTLIALWTGAVWGKPTWGTWWVWDARLTSELVLLFLYLGYLALTRSVSDARRAANAGALLALVGVVNVPIIYFSVRWWNTLHQGATLSATAAPKMEQTMLAALLLTTAACWSYSFAVAFSRTSAAIREHKFRSQEDHHEPARLEEARLNNGAQA